MLLAQLEIGEEVLVVHFVVLRASEVWIEAMVEITEDLQTLYSGFEQLSGRFSAFDIIRTSSAPSA